MDRPRWDWFTTIARPVDLARSVHSGGGLVRTRCIATAWLVVVGLASVVLSGWGGGVAAAEEKVALHGAGATFPAPLYQKWIEVYRRQQPDLAIAYDVVGSGEGR